MNHNPFEQILKTCKFVLENAKHVKIDEKQINKFIEQIKDQTTKHWLSSNPCGILDLKIDELVHFLIILGSINYSFWGEPKWTIKTDKGPIDGAFAQIYVLMKLRTQKGHLNFENITFEEFKKAYQGNVEIPFLKKRYETVKQISQIINSKMNGNFYRFIKDIKTDQELLEIITTYFPSFEDKRTYHNKTIYFYKLAQLATSDILQIREQQEKIKTDYSNLVGCADYKIPQVLRDLGILIYDQELSSIVDQKQSIEENSIYEIEIRASMIVAINKIKQKTNRKAIEINDLIWSFGQNKNKNWRPYHLTRTTSY